MYSNTDTRKWFSRKEGNVTVIRFVTDNRKWRATVEGNVTVIRFV